MIVAIVRFPIDPQLPADEVRAMFESSAPTYQKLPGLKRKHYLRAELDTLLKQHESKTLEFKSTLRWNLKENRKDPAVTNAVIKTIAAFLNTPLGDRAGTCVDPRMQIVKGKTVCVVTCQRSPEPVFMKAKEMAEEDKGEF